jgi:hypothetical protein
MKPIALTASTLRATAASYDRLRGFYGLWLTCSCLWRCHPTTGCPTHDPEHCTQITELRASALERRRIAVAVSQVAEFCDAEACGGIGDDGEVCVALLEPARRNADTHSIQITSTLVPTYVVNILHPQPRDI